MLQIIQYQKTGEMRVDELPAPKLRSGGVLVRNLFSLVSAGTERTSVETAQASMLQKARLRPDWARRWMIDPALMSPGTAMPSGLFRQDENRWVFAGPTPAGFQQFKKDHAELLVRYIFEFTPEEQRRLPGSSGGSKVSTAAALR